MAKVIFSPEEQKYLADSDYLQKEVRKLEGEKAKLIAESNSVVKKISDLKEQQIDLEKKAKEIIANAQTEAKAIVLAVQDKLNKANVKDGQAASQLSELKQKTKEAEDLIKSNSGLQKSLTLQNENLKDKSIKLSELAKKIRELAETL